MAAWIALHSRPTLYSVRVTSKTGLNMREEPATSAEVAAKIPYFETIKVITDSTVQTDAGPMERWYEVNYDGSFGWVSAKHVKKL
ncbi:SH3 domain-containing protein [Hymenobacter sp. 102]|uniref:SH3 domain-containing protein n=1 Tax=Hymenobacter sp. 102 TaxID=3403152 RepID=UPI003CF80D50